jgi:hypothetical protein
LFETTPGSDFSFILLNTATGKSNLSLPDSVQGQVLCNDTGAELGTREDIMNLGRWIVDVARYAAGATARKQRKRSLSNRVDFTF